MFYKLQFCRLTEKPHFQFSLSLQYQDEMATHKIQLKYQLSLLMYSDLNNNNNNDYNL